VENQTEKKIKLFRIDDGGDFCKTEFEELCKNEFEEFYKKCGIAQYKTIPYTPQQNGVA